MIKSTLAVIAVYFSFGSFSQEMSKEQATDVLKRIAKNYLQENYSLSYSKKTFQAVGETIPIENSNGTFYFGKNNSYRLEDEGLLVIQNEELSMAVDNGAKTIYISEVDKNFLPLNLDSFKNDSIMKSFSFSLKKKGGISEFVITNKDELSNQMILTLDAKSLEVRQFAYYFPAGNYISETMDDETIETPYMVIDYQPLKKGLQQEQLFTHSEWLLIDNTPLKLTPEKSGFDLQDLRIASHL